MPDGKRGPGELIPPFTPGPRKTEIELLEQVLGGIISLGSKVDRLIELSGGNKPELPAGTAKVREIPKRGE